MIRQKIRSSPAPSTRPASSRSLGSPRMNWRMRKTPNGLTRNGRKRPGSVSTSPAFATSTKSGTKVTTPGIISVPMTATKIAFLPLKSSIARA